MEKILIGNKQYIGKQNVDNYIDVDLLRTVETIKRDTLDNVFDFQQQYNLERNDSMKFCVYGLIESRFGHCDNVAIKVSVGDSDMSGNTVDVMYVPNMWSAGTSGYSFTTLSYPLNGNSNNSKYSFGKNLYGAAKGSYFILFELDKYEILKSKKNKSVFLEVYEPIKELFGKFSIPIIYFDSDGDLIEFGTQNAEINNNNEVVEINNDFPFFYDRHWVKNNIQPIGPNTVFFLKEGSQASETTNNVNIEVSLNEPSTTGLERVRIVVDFGVDKNGNQLTTSDFGTDFIFVEPIINWSVGEQKKSFPVKILNDFIVEKSVETIVFKILPISNVKINPSQQYRYTLRIESDDIPVKANFSAPIYYVFEPNINVSQFSAYTIDVQFSSPITVPGEKIGIELFETSGLTLGQDFFFDPNNQTSSEFEIFTSLSGTGVSFPVYIRANKVYDVERTLKLRIKQLTNNITLGDANFETKIVVNDGLTKKFVQYIIPFDLQKGTAAFKVIYNGTNIITSSVAKLKREQPDPTISFQTQNLSLTHLFTCELRIKNLGKRMVWDNKYIEPLQYFYIPINFSAATSDIVIELPTNETFNNIENAYRNCKYEMRFVNFSQNYPNNLPANWKNLADEANYFAKTIVTESFTGSTSGQAKKYLITELTDVETVYDEIADVCLLTGTSINQQIKYNGAIFLPSQSITHNYGTTLFSRSTLRFSNNKVLHRCSATGATLPVGLEIIPDPPYVEKFVKIDLGSIYLQGGYIAINSADKLKLGAANTPGAPSAHEYFKTWQATNIDTKVNAKLRIHNKGDRDVVILGKTINTYSYNDFDSNDLDFQNISLILPTNEGYSASTNSFSHTNYLFELIDFRIYNGNSYSNQSISKTLPIFSVTGDSLVNIQTYYITAKYNNVKVGSSLFGNFSCNINPLTSPNLITKNIYMNDMLLFANTGTISGPIIYKTSKITPECPQSLMKYEFF